ncbi:ATP-binding protein [Enterococcus timonensis]|uniref:ATP-binding protein n=1 Tax=Enterococcus timonensis TaxID=1852364 RepID=UPI0008DA22AF|nr:AAA family ATPase [Enterococcus timonensis]
MILKKAEIIGFGKYQQAQFQFEEELMLFYGDNEAGKSTLYQFILAMLFGFAKKSKFAKDYTPKSGARFGGHLWLETEAGLVKVSRFKDEKEPQVTMVKTGLTGGENFLKELIKPLTRGNFEQVFSFQQEQLQDWQGLDANDLQKLLLSLGLSGSQQFLTLSTKLENDGQKIYKKTGRQPLLNQKLTELATLNKKIIEKENTESAYQQLVETSGQLTDQLATLKIQQEKTQQQVTFAQKQTLAQPLYQELQALEKVGSVPLTDTEEAQLSAYYQQYENHQQNIQSLSEQIKSRSGEKTVDSNDYYFYLEHEKYLAEIVASAPDWHQRQTDLAKLEAVGAIKQQEAEVLEKKYDFSPTQMPQLFSEEQKKILASSLTKFTEAQKLTARTNPLLARPVLVVVGLILLGASFFLPQLAKVAAWLLAGVIIIFAIFQKPTPKNQVPQATLDKWGEEFSTIQKNYQLGRFPLEKMLQENPAPETYRALQEELAENKEAQGEIRQKFFSAQQKWKNLFPEIKTGTLLENLAEIQAFVQKMGQIQFAKEQNDLKQIQKELFELRQKNEQLASTSQALVKKAGLHYLYEVPRAEKNWAQMRQDGQRRKQILAQLADFELSADQGRGTFGEVNFPQFNSAEVNPAEIDIALVNPAEINQAEKNQAEVKSAELNLDQLKSQLTHQEIQINQLNKQSQEFIVRAELMTKDGTLAQLEQDQAELLAEISQLAQLWGSDKIALSLLQDLSGELSQQQLPQLLKKVGEFLAVLTSGRYQKIIFHDNLFSIQSLDGQFWSVQDLSSGTRDQLFFSFRLGFLAVRRQEARQTVIIDDGWLRYDEHRKQNFLNVLQKMSQYYQIILLSSDVAMVTQFQTRDQIVISLNEI